jgi:hypothetical protein
MKTRTFPVYSDPGHAWVKVPIAFLTEVVGLQWRKHFTCFSYERGAYVYLEEDQDAPRFVKQCRAAGIEPVFKEGSSCASRYSRIRNYAQLAPI